MALQASGWAIAKRQFRLGTQNKSCTEMYCHRMLGFGILIIIAKQETWQRNGMISGLRSQVSKRFIHFESRSCSISA
jgi:hypothetical protein